MRAELVDDRLRARNPAPDHRFRAVLVGLVLLVALAPGAQAQAPYGGYVQVGPAGWPGAGAQFALVSVRDFHTRAFSVLADFRPGVRGSVQASFAVGVAARLFSFERIIGNAPYRGFDIDVGLRIGPGFMFRLDETRLTRNQRFNLNLEAFARLVARRKNRLFYAELGNLRPSLRIGLWVPLKR